MISSFSLDQSLNSSVQWKRKMSCEHKETNGTGFDSLNKEKSRNYHGPVLRREERFLNKMKLNCSRWMKTLITINGSDYAMLD